MIGYRGPEHREELYNLALSVLGVYLTDSAVSPLQKVFVETEDALAGDVTFQMQHLKCKGLLFAFDSVQIDALNSIVAEFDATLRALYQDGFDMKRLHNLIQKQYLEVSILDYLTQQFFLL